MTTFDAKTIADLRALQRCGMRSAVGEYTPGEFWDALDAIESRDVKIASLQAKCLALEAAAARYECIKAQASTQDRDGGWSGHWVLPDFEAWNDSPNPDYAIPHRTLDEAIDASIATKRAR